MSTASAIYEGVVSHVRHVPVEHRFRYRQAMVLLDLDELPALTAGRAPLLSTRPRAPIAFRREDYHGDPAVPLADAARALVGERTGASADGPVRLLANLASFGHCYNPVAFMYCHAADGQLQAVVAEVNNTPWGERHAYVLDCRGEQPEPGGTIDKRLHVSPFQAMDETYSWQAQAPGETLRVELGADRDGERVFDATLQMRRRPLTRAALARMALRTPLPSLSTLARIYGQAIALKLKGVPYFPNPHTGEAR